MAGVEKEPGAGGSLERWRRTRNAFLAVATIGLITALIATPVGEILFVGGATGAGASQIGLDSAKNGANRGA